MPLSKFTFSLFPGMVEKHEYSQVFNSENVLSDTDSVEKASFGEQGKKNNRRWISDAAAVFFASLSLALLIAYITKHPTDQQCGRQISAYSPLFDAVEYEEVELPNQFDHKTIYRGPPTRKIESAWWKLVNYGGLSIPLDKMLLLNRSAETDSWKPTASGDGYYAQFEVFHQLHCLNFIRQFTWRDYFLSHPDIVDRPEILRSSDVGLRMHVDHCIETLRITLMCHGDTTPYLIRLDPNMPMGGMADFSPHRKCVRFDALTDYMKKNSVQ